LDAHGGLDRWNKLKGLTARMSISAEHLDELKVQMKDSAPSLG
jgi:hypothetical protein